MNRTRPLLALVVILFPALCRAQKLAQIDCSRGETYTYLYSSTTTMEVRTTLKCGMQVHAYGRFDNFYRVRTDNGDDGFVPMNNLSFIKPPATTASKGKGKQPPTPTTTAPAHAAPVEITLPRQTAVHLKFTHDISSATAKVNEEVTFEVAEDVVVGRLLLIAKGAPATGTVTVAEPKRRMGHGGKLTVSATSVRLADNEAAALRSFQEDKGAEPKTGKMLPFMKGKDITFAQGTEMTAYTDADMRLKIAKFHAAPPSSPSAAASHP